MRLGLGMMVAIILVAVGCSKKNDQPLASEINKLRKENVEIQTQLKKAQLQSATEMKATIAKLEAQVTVLKVNEEQSKKGFQSLKTFVDVLSSHSNSANAETSAKIQEIQKDITKLTSFIVKYNQVTGLLELLEARLLDDPNAPLDAQSRELLSMLSDMIGTLLEADPDNQKLQEYKTEVANVKVVSDFRALRNKIKSTLREIQVATARVIENTITQINAAKDAVKAGIDRVLSWFQTPPPMPPAADDEDDWEWE